MKYRTVVGDPPWPIAGLREHAPMMKHGRKPIYRDRAPPAEYSLMSAQDLLDFPIDDFAAEEAVLFLWVTNGKIADGTPIIGLGLKMLEKWGFTYHTIITWFKHQGMSYHSPIRTASEHVLFGWRGSFSSLVPCHCQMDSVLETSYQVRASQKPAKFYQLLRAWTPEPRIDLFARRVHPGFDGWGDQYVGNSSKGTLEEFIEEAEV